MNHQNTVNQKDELVSVTYSLVTMVIVYLVSTFVMVIMIVWITATKMIDINAVSSSYFVYYKICSFRLSRYVFVELHYPKISFFYLR